MRAAEKERLGTVRLILAAIKQREVDERIALDDTQVLAVLEKMVKQRRESITQFQAGSRQDLVAKEQAELGVIGTTCPPTSWTAIDALIADGHRTDQRRIDQGHGQGDDSDQVESRGTRRHGCGGGAHQGAPVGASVDYRPMPGRSPKLSSTS